MAFRSNSYYSKNIITYTITIIPIVIPKIAQLMAFYKGVIRYKKTESSHKCFKRDFG